MIAEAIEKILKLQRPPTFRADEKTFFDNNQPVLEQLEPTIAVHTLTGIVDRITSHGIVPEFILVSDHSTVLVCDEVFGPFLQRPVLIRADLVKPEDAYRFGNFYDAENFNIRLQSQFVQDETTAAILALVGNIKQKDVRSTSDDGVTQTVVTKQGITKVAETEIPNPVVLHPYQTFLEVEQPPLKCVLRLRTNKDDGLPDCALFEADGGQWRHTAIASIRDWLKAKLPNIPVIA